MHSTVQCTEQTLCGRLYIRTYVHITLKTILHVRTHHMYYRAQVGPIHTCVHASCTHLRMYNAYSIPNTHSAHIHAPYTYIYEPHMHTYTHHIRTTHAHIHVYIHAPYMYIRRVVTRKITKEGGICVSQ